MKKENFIDLAYGSTKIPCSWSLPIEPVVIQATFLAAGNPEKLVREALEKPIGRAAPFGLLTPHSQIAITINDKTRPVPNGVLIAPLLNLLSQMGVPIDRITFFIASGTHKPMKPAEFIEILPMEIVQSYKVVAHDCDHLAGLKFIGHTTQGTPVWINADFYHADLRIVVGDIEPHHFAGYSGGVKSAAIGLCGRETISANHRLLLDDRSTIGTYEQNPLRMDIEEIGSLIKVDLALNSILDDQKKIIEVFFGAPMDVMRAGISLVDQMCRIPIREKFDVVIASAGGYPRDINLYQAQKAMSTSAQFCKPGGKLILVAECRDGIGSDGYEQFIKEVKSVDDVISRFSSQEFALGAHKAFLTAKIQHRVHTYLYSAIPSGVVSRLFFTPVTPNQHGLRLSDHTKSIDRVAILPYANVCMPSQA